MKRILFVVIFEGRTGSSELMARLNVHPSIQAFPEILAPICPADRSWNSRRADIHKMLSELKNGDEVKCYTETYTKVGAEADGLPVRGFKTRLNDIYDRAWYKQIGRTQNFYQVESGLLLPLLEEFDFYLIRLSRRDLIRNAVSWLRGARLAEAHGDRWNIEKGQAGLESTRIDPSLLVHTVAWLGAAKAAHDTAYDLYKGPKLSLTYEDLFSKDSAEFKKLQEFLGVAEISLQSFYTRVTDQDLSVPISNYREVAQYMREWGLGKEFETER